MKVVYFNYLDDRLGISIGSTRKAELLMEGLGRLGFAVRICWRKPLAADRSGKKNRIRPSFRKALSSLFHEPVQLLRNLKYLIVEFGILRREKPDVLVLRTSNLLFSAAVLAKRFRIPLVVEADAPNRERRTYHRGFLTVPHLGEWIEKAVIRSAHMTVCVSSVARDHFIRQGVREDLLRVIPNGADPDRLTVDSSRLRHSLGIGPDRIVIGFVGSFHYWHGVDLLIELMRRMLVRYPHCVFLLVGHGGPRKPEVESFISGSPHGDRIIVTGYVPYDDIPRHLGVMDIALAPYPDTDFFHFSPVKIYEYMAAGVPVLSSHIGQIGELITDGVDGMLCPPGDVECYTCRLSEWIEDREKRKAVGLRARRTIAENHTWAHRARAWADVLESVRGRVSSSRRKKDDI